jgi:hypothetical protein
LRIVFVFVSFSFVQIGFSYFVVADVGSQLDQDVVTDFEWSSPEAMTPIVESPLRRQTPLDAILTSDRFVDPYGQGETTPFFVPEGASATFLGLGLIAMWRRRLH